MNEELKEEYLQQIKKLLDECQDITLLDLILKILIKSK